jgi:hypothetical protein
MCPESLHWMGSTYSCGLLVRFRPCMSRICILGNQMLWVFGACLSHMPSMPVEASPGNAFQCGRILRDTRTNIAGIHLSGGQYRTWHKCMRPLHDELCTYRKKCIGMQCVRCCRTWYTRASGMRSCRDDILIIRGASKKKLPLGRTGSDVPPEACCPS